MKTAIIIMTILGCDDTATQCHYVQTVDQQWATIQTCDAASEARLKGFSNLEYPVVVAVCQTPEDTGIADAKVEDGTTAPATAQQTAPDVAAAAGNAAMEKPGIAGRVLAQIKDVLPAAASVKALIVKPVHFVTDGYSWVAQRFEK